LRTFPDKQTGEPRRFYVWTPSDFVRNKALSADARFLLMLLRTYTNHVNKPAYPTDWTLQEITGWGRNKLAKVFKEVREKTGTEIRPRKKAGRFCGRNVFLPKWFFHDRVPNSGLR
jgi:hypothetical protein